VRGGLGCSEVTGSRFGTAFFSGIPLEIGHCIESTRCTYDVLSFGAEVAGTFQGGHIGFVVLMGGLDIDHELVASSTTIDSCDVEGPARLALTGCTLGNLRYQTPYESPLLEMYRCLVLRNLMVGPDLGVRWPGEPFAAGGALPTLGETGPGYVTGLLLEHNTIAGDLSLELTGRQPPTRLVQDNIIGGHATVVTPWSMTFSYNLIGGDLAVTGPVTFTNNYPNTDPQFCNPAIGDYRIAFRSPAVGAAHDGLAIGALGVGCTTVSVQPTTWGRLKALFH
jgi:hypothetical protein